MFRPRLTYDGMAPDTGIRCNFTATPTRQAALRGCKIRVGAGLQIAHTWLTWTRTRIFRPRMMPISSPGTFTMPEDTCLLRAHNLWDLQTISQQPPARARRVERAQHGVS